MEDAPSWLDKSPEHDLGTVPTPGAYSLEADLVQAGTATTEESLLVFDREALHLKSNEDNIMFLLLFKDEY